MPETASDLLLERLIDWGVDTIFGLPGDGINGLWESLRTHRDRIRYVHVRHEEVAAMAAVGYAKFTGRLGVCASTAGPGAIHLANGLLDARLEGVPLLAITGMTYHDLIGTHYLQDYDADVLYANLAAYSQRIMGPEHIVNVVDLACRTALSNRVPAHLSFPIDYQTADAEDLMRYKRNVEGHTTTAYKTPVRVPEETELRRAAEVLRGHSRVAILAGQGARGAGDELEQLAETLGAPIIKAQLGKDCVPDDSAYVTGAIGVVGTRPSQDAIEGCDALVIVGSSFPYIEFLPEPGQAVCVQIDDRPERIGLRHPADVGLVGDARATLAAWLGHVDRNEDRDFLEQAQAGVRDWYALMEERGTRDDVPMKPQVVAWSLQEALADDAILCGDSGTVTTWAARTELRRGQLFSFSGTMCSMMAALPYAIGAQAAYPDRQVVALTGDGSMTMMMGELATLAQHGLPVKVVVMRNDVLGLIKWEQMAFLGNPQYGVELAPVDFVKVAEACGLKGVRIEDPATAGDELARALAMDGPVLIEAVVDPHDMPMTPTINQEHAKGVAWGLAQGQPNRERIALTMSRVMAREMEYSTSPAGVLARAKDKLGGGGNGHGG
jgi:pyruvate dehydrogenase (quinone)